MWASSIGISHKIWADSVKLSSTTGKTSTMHIFLLKILHMIAPKKTSVGKDMRPTSQRKISNRAVWSESPSLYSF